MRRTVTIENLAWDAPARTRVVVRELDGMIWEPVFRGTAEELRKKENEFLNRTPSNWFTEGDTLNIYVK